MEQWFLYTKKADFSQISGKFNISPILARIIRNRDVQGDDDIKRYLSPDLGNTYDPFALKDMDKAADVLDQVIKSGGKIRIIGDYDADGVCSSVILASFLEKAGADVDVRLPDRFADGYGMNEQMVIDAASDFVSLIITCDNGISCIDQVRIAKEYGIRVIITDHHEPGEIIPDADAVIDAKQKDCAYPFKEMCGAAAAYKLIQAYNLISGLHMDELLDELLQFVGLATIADIVPLRDENRIFAYQGIQRLKKTENPGLCALMKARGIEKSRLDASKISFIIAPCINSAGRIKNASIAYELLRCQDTIKAQELANELSELNEIRKDLTASQTQKALEELSDPECRYISDKILTVFLPDAHESVAGIIAGRLKDEYNRPVFVITRSSEGLKGSGRSIEAYNMIGGLQKVPELFVKYGGHPMACGFTLHSDAGEETVVSNFRNRINENCTLRDEDMIRRVWIDMELPFKYVTQDLVRELAYLEPFGTGNKRPVFAARDVTVLNAQIRGINKNTLKLLLKDRYGYSIDGVMFGEEKIISEKYQDIVNSDRINILYYPELNEFRGCATLQIRVGSLKCC